MQFEPSAAIAYWAKYAAAKSAVIHADQAWTYKTLNDRISKLASSVQLLPPEHRRIAVACGNDLSLLTSILAVVRAGRSAVIIPRNLEPEPLAYCLANAAVLAAIADSRSDSTTSLQTVMGPKGIVIDYATDDITNTPSPPTTGSLPADSEWAVFYSSGTTGLPKGIVRDHYSVVVELLGWCLELSLNQNHTFLVGRPVYYTGGLLIALSALLMGSTLVLEPSLTWSTYQDVLREQHIHFTFLIPSQLRQFVLEAKECQPSILSADTILLLGEPISGDEKLEARSVLRSAIVESWGNSESLGTITRPEDLDCAPDSIGRPFLTDEMYIVSENGEPLPPGEVGYIAGSQDAAFSEYCANPEATGQALRNNMVVSEDLGYVDDSGLFYIEGRKNEVIEIDGQHLSLVHLENRIRRDGLVRDICIACLPNPTGPAELGAAVVPLEPDNVPPDAAAILRSIVSHLPPGTHIKTLVTLPSLPKTPTGKIIRHAVLDILAAPNVYPTSNSELHS